MERWKGSWKKWVFGGTITAAAGVLGVCSFVSAQSREESVLYKETQIKKGTITVGVTESGSVTIGTNAQDLDDLQELESSGAQISDTQAASAQNTADTQAAQGQNMFGSGTAGSSDSSTGLEVGEVFLSVGESARVGDAILKLTAESVAEYKKDLEDACNTAQLALKKAELEAKTSKLNAQHTYNTDVAQGSTAQSEYDATIAELQASVDLARAKAEESAEKISDFQKKISNGESCSAELAMEQANYNALAAKLQSAQNSQAIQTVEAKQKYEEAMLAYSNAGNVYQMNTSDIDVNVEEAQEELEEAQDMLSYFQALIGDGTIYAQYAGTVFSLGYTKGDTLSASVNVAEFTDAENVTMAVSVSQEDIASVQVGNDVEIALTAYEDKTYEGKVKAVDTSASSGTSTVSYEVTVVFTGDAGDVYQDMTGNVTFVSAQADDVLYVSRKAIVREGRDTSLNIKREDGTMEAIPVTVGITDGINIEIAGDIQEGDTVLIESQVAEK